MLSGAVGLHLHARLELQGASWWPVVGRPEAEAPEPQWGGHLSDAEPAGPPPQLRAVCCSESSSPNPAQKLGSPGRSCKCRLALEDRDVRLAAQGAAAARPQQATQATASER